MWESVSRFLLGPRPEGSDSTTVTWVQLSEWSVGEQVAIFVLVAVVLGLTLWNLRRVRRLPTRLGLLSLRALLLAVLLFAFYQPALLEETRALSTNTVVLLVDDSASMALPTVDGTRREAVERQLKAQEELWKSVSQTNALEAYRFGGGLEGGLATQDWRSLGTSLTSVGDTTPILETLEAVQARYRNRDLGGIVLVSDGIDNGRASKTFGRSGSLDAETVRLLQSFGAPIHTFGFGEEGVSDVAVRELRYSPFAFKRTLASIEAAIDVAGFDSGVLEVELLEDGKLVRSVTRDIEPGQRKYSASFDFTPMEMGYRVYTVRVKPLAGEVTTENNARHAVIRVNRDKIRVLQIAGHPSWDERFLRNHLKRTPNVQLISFFILVSSGAQRVVSQQETALIPFPAEELFDKELGSFDLVVFQDFNYGPFSTPEHLPKVRDWIQGGGAFLMVGGRLAFGAGGYDGTALEDVLPVVMATPTLDDEALDESSFQAQLTQAGESHSITRLAFDAPENRALWAGLPPLSGVNRFTRLKEGAQALVAHPALKGEDGRPMPVIAAGEAGKGRVVVVGTDSLWNWKMPVIESGGDGTRYDTFIDNMVRWLIKDPDLELVRVTPSVGVRALGESVDIDVRVFQPDYKPAAHLAVTIRLNRRAEDGTAGVLVYESSGLESDEAGHLTLSRLPEQAGIYDVTARATIAGREMVGSTVFVVADERPEMREVRPTLALLAAISDATGGTTYSVGQPAMGLSFSKPRVSDVTGRVYHDQWNTPLVLIIGVLLFVAEWTWRRRAGLL